MFIFERTLPHDGVIITVLQEVRKDMDDIRFDINPYDICVANLIVNGKQNKITWYVNKS